MSLVDIADRFDGFQSDAVNAIARDFKGNPKGRFLLVIPTGGGKTFTAVKAINQLFELGIYDPNADTVLWTAHHTELLDQAKDTFIKFKETNPACSHDDRVALGMISSVKKQLSEDKTIKLVIIDEAHHGAANSYQPIFENQHIGVLGLTATPSRHDGLPLAFDRESYSIGFPDLVKRGVVLRPQVRRIEGGSYDITSIDDDNLECLDNHIRNQKIIAELLERHEQYKKVIIYVGTKTHVQSLYQQLRDSELCNLYESISYITGEGNSRNEDREDFIAKEKTFFRSILVNVQVLSEGYDDPSLNTVVMATPTRSKLYYMQAMGRCIRHDPNDSLKKAHIIEVEDDLPNIRYRIDNRWLYADISDVLEPAVADFEFISEKDLFDRLNQVYNQYSVPESLRIKPDFDPDDRYTLLLFRKYVSAGRYDCYPMLIRRNNRIKVSNMFNFLSERMASFKQQKINSEAAFRMLGTDGTGLVTEQAARYGIYNAMENSVPADEYEEQAPFIVDGRPWITFVAFHFRQRETEFPADLLKFLEGMINREEILESLRLRNYESGSWLIKLPLPLRDYFGRIVTEPEQQEVSKIITNLSDLRASYAGKDHRLQVQDVLGRSVLPIELAYINSLVLIAREGLEYKYALN